MSERLSESDTPELFIGLTQWLHYLGVFESVALDWLSEHEAEVSTYSKS